MTHFLCFIAVAVLLAAGCAKAPPAPPAMTIAAGANASRRASMTIAAAADVNPDVNGRPSPIVVRIYQLRTDAAFGKAEFFALFDDEQKILGEELISRDEFMVAPGEKRTLDIALAGETRFVAALAAFRDIRNAQWRGILETPKGGVTVGIERAGVALTPAK
jgi:type VI secretion system protein VasD